MTAIVNMWVHQYQSVEKTLNSENRVIQSVTHSVKSGRRPFVNHFSWTGGFNGYTTRVLGIKMEVELVAGSRTHCRKSNLSP